MTVVTLVQVWHLAALGGHAASCGKDEAVPTISVVDAVPSSACTQAGEDLCFCETKVHWLLSSGKHMSH